MKIIIGVRFKKPGKVYFFDPGTIHINVKTKVIVETALGEELGEVVVKKKMLPNVTLTTPLKKIVRIATPKDIKHYEENKKKEQEAFKICEEKIKKLKLQMHLTEVQYSFDNSKLLFCFTADGRIDFRELVKELAAIFKTRIELRQIGVRDEVRRIGGNGVCGRELCCCSFLNNFEAAEEGKKHLQNEKEKIIASIQNDIPTLIKKFSKKNLEKKLGFEPVDMSTAYFPKYIFQYVSSGGAQPRDESPLQQIAGDACVLADGYQRLSLPRLFLGGQHLGGRQAHLIGQIGVQAGVDHAADAVGSK